jgi:O-antigen/teichoic acid export membrane protein
MYSIFLGICATLFLWILAEPLIILLGGSEFVNAIPALQILSLAAGVSIIGGFFVSVALAGKKKFICSSIRYTLS